MESFQTVEDTSDPPESEGNVTAIVAKVNLQEERTFWQALHQ
jgi:hypothetical protein